MTATRTLIDIPNHPKIAEITRKAAVIKSQPYYKYDNVPVEKDELFKKAIILDVLVLHYDKNGDFIEMGNNNGVVYLISDEVDYVNPQTFEKVDKDTPGAMLEYDVLWSMLYDVKNVTDIQLQEQFIRLRLDKINEKLYN